MAGPIRYLSVLVLTLSALLLGGGQASAMTLPGGGSEAPPSSGNCPGCSGGTVYWYELRNTGKTLRKIPARFAWNAPMRKNMPRGGIPKVANNLTRYMMAPCQASWKHPNCVLWHDKRKASSSYATGTWYEVHAPYPGASEDVQAKIGVAWNVRIWRENPARAKFDLIFERRVGSRSPRGVDSDPSETWFRRNHPNIDAADATWNWFQGGSFSKKHLYGASGITSAGPLSDLRAGSCQGRANAIQRNNRSSRFDLSLTKNRNGVFQRSLKIIDRGRTNSSAPTPNRARGSYYCYWEGAQIGPRFFRWGKASGTQGLVNAFQRNSYFYWKNGKKRRLKNGDSQFGTNLTKIKGRFKPGADPQRVSQSLSGVIGAGTREAFEIHWSLRNRKPRIRVTGAGAPGLFYAIQVVRIDRGEMIVPTTNRISGVSKNTYWPGWPRKKFRGEAQLFRTYLLNPILPEDRIPDCVPPKVCDETFTDPGTAPDVDMNLTTETTTVTNQPTGQQLTLEPVFDNLTRERQFVFPMSSKLTHYTPQLGYSTPCRSGKVYDQAGYVAYQPEPGLPPQLVNAPNRYTPAAVPCATNNAKQVDFAKEMAWKEDLEGGVFQEPLLTTTWLKPTLENPCGVNSPSADETFDGGIPNWPNRPRACPNWPKFFNGWDDLFTLQATWQKYWTDGLKDDTVIAEKLGYVKNQKLRCSDPTPGGKKKLDQCVGWNYSSADKAQGYMLLPKETGRRFPVRVKLVTKKPVDRFKVTGAGIIPRSGAVDQLGVEGISSRSSSIINTISNYAEMNYCNQGVPAGARVAGVSTASLPKADPNCEGYALVWRRSGNQCKVASPLNVPSLSGLVAAAPVSRRARLQRLVDELIDKSGDYSPDVTKGLWNPTVKSPFFTPAGRSCRRANGATGAHPGWWDLANVAQPANKLNVGFNETANRPVGVGFGLNNYGPAIPTDVLGQTNTVDSGWIPEFTFLPGHNVRWKMLADYWGYTNKVWWYTKETKTKREFVRVLSPRNSR